ncbi:MAG: cytidylate kinase-like family protein [Actinobacteria bacterium]|nr:cytidylate kinase-like family protein [Actinomycetota bacterium]
MPGVTISAAYGAGGQPIARLVANQLGFTYLDRAISSEVAAKLHVTTEEAEGAVINRSLAERFFTVLAPMAGGVIGTDPDALAEAPLPGDDAARFRQQAEVIMRRALKRGAVILGRAGGAAFRQEADVLRVRLFGPREARIDLAARRAGVARETAAARLPQVDRARAQYVRRLYDRDVDDPDLYQLQLDSTAIPEDGCAAAIVAAFRSFAPSVGPGLDPA